jgi:hypothetical protein
MGQGDWYRGRSRSPGLDEKNWEDPPSKCEFTEAVFIKCLVVAMMSSPIDHLLLMDRKTERSCVSWLLEQVFLEG